MTDFRESKRCSPHEIAQPTLLESEQPSPLGRGCPAAGAFISRSGTGEGSFAPLRRSGEFIPP